ncbi:hypothetical protein [Cupriavidus sp. AcVe19-6a]|uniref:hypothetical protein n=1 Tax=Cupriavidus sp. AcVe19-6a TaxID=2821358 RepID=UPI001AE24B15|nr:hypothetical protein [Cupriavidus sp. AcVe19-6a]MBP0637435.1 hypothetical protein [Cupriavidus sp. AcVe19-6a]
MPWNPDRYPAAMKRLAPAVRLKAIEIANAMLASGHDEGMAIRVAIAGARRWARSHPDQPASAPPARPDRDQWL